MPAASASGPGFGIYVHWPFCQAKCPYCDFNSHVRNRVDHARWRNALTRELEHMAVLGGKEPVTSVFFGGGTPSLMQPETVEAVLDRIAALWPLAEEVEITLEANPTSADAGRFRGYRAAGVNRLSLGVQALDDTALKRLGRLHDVEEALAAVALARDIFPRLSFDLIYARPGQTIAAWTEELRRALGFAADHLSLYQLTIEPGTTFFDLQARGALTVPHDDEAAAYYEVTRKVTEAAGLPAYEISNHAAAGAESRHNLTYWRYGRYAGIGPGAHGRLSAGGKRHALSTLRAPEAWLAAVEAQGHGIDTYHALTAGEQGREFLLMGLRLAEGVDLARYEALAGAPLDADRVAALTEEGLLRAMPGRRLAATAAGRLLLNAVIAELVD
ncbi:MAG: radical SAM family heme chaperone HemW [Alphaproteobacteria bacterium]